MRICLATYESVPMAMGGPFTKIIETKKYLAELGNEVELFNMWDTVERLKEFDVIHLVGANFSSFGFARSLMQRKIPFIIEPVFYSNRSPAFIKLLSAADKTVRKFLRGVWFDYGILRDICSWASLISPNTTDEEKLLSKAFSIPKDKFHVIPNGVSEKFLHADPSLFIKEYGIKDFILNVGHIGPQRKNILALVKALNKIDYPSVIIGKTLQTGETDLIKEELKKNKNITLINALPNNSELLASAYAACDTFVLPSLFETPGIAALEAALAGAKIVITPHGGTKDYFKDMAEYVDPFSIDSIKNGIEKSLNKSKNDELKNYVNENFLWEKIAERSMEVYSLFQSVK